MDIYWLWLSLLKYVGPVLQKELLLYFGTPKAVYQASEEELTQVQRINKRAVQSICSSRSLKEAEAITKKAEKNRVSILAFNDELYPAHARECKESPIILYYKGHLQPIHTAVGVVGARRCSRYGKSIAEKIGEELATRKIPVISGFAKGIDTYAQAACIREGGYTIAFLGNGPDICYPSEQKQLYHKVLEQGGGFLSQYPPGAQPIPKRFLQRNALISAWSSELVVVEAGEKSGALWTAEFAKKNGKAIYAVPNQIDFPEGEGTNLLISQGIPPYLGIHSLKTVKNIKKEEEPAVTSVHDANSTILKALANSPTSISSLANQLNQHETTLMDQLFDLELNKKIRIRGNFIYKT